MDKNTLLAFLLIGALLIGINLNTQKIKEKEAARRAANAPTQTEQIATNDGETPTENGENVMGVAANLGQLNAKKGKGTPVSIENNQLKITFDTKGGRIAATEVKDFKTYNGQPILLLDGEKNVFNYQIPVNLGGSGLQNLDTKDYVFDIKESSANKVVFSLDLNGQGSVEQEYRFDVEDYSLYYDFRLIGLDEEISNNSAIALLWETGMRQQEKNADNEKDVTSIYYKETEETSASYLTEAGSQAEDITQNLDWIGFKQKFFNQTLIAKDGFSGAKLTTLSPDKATEDYIKTLQASTVIPFKASSNFSYPMNWYLGPNKYSILSAKDNDMEKMIGLGWGIFGFVNRWLIIPMFNFLNGFFTNYGLIILLLTLLIKLALSPLTYRSYVSMAKMQVLKPEIDEIKKKYPEDAAMQQTETMKLYSSAGASPLSGCLPNLLQMPILIAMYNFFPAALELRQEKFLWADDLSSYDSILDLPFSLPLYGAHVSLFAILSGLAILLSAKMNAQMSAGNDNPAMKYLPYIMPIFLILIFNRFSAALTYYFFLSNVFTFAQQEVIKRFFIDEKAIHAQMQENKKNPKKKSAFQERLQEAMRQQQMNQQKKG